MFDVGFVIALPQKQEQLLLWKRLKSVYFTKRLKEAIYRLRVLSIMVVFLCESKEANFAAFNEYISKLRS